MTDLSHKIGHIGQQDWAQRLCPTVFVVKAESKKEERLHQGGLTFMQGRAGDGTWGSQILLDADLLG